VTVSDTDDSTDLDSNIFSDVEDRGINSGEFKGLIYLAMKSRYLFHSQFCVRFSGMGFCTKVSEHAKIAR